MIGPGSRLGAYDLVSLLGTGGMSEVYRARDTRLQRDVAIKLLPASVAADADRLARTGFDVSPDGKRLLMVREVKTEDQAGPSLTVVLDWFAEFRKVR